MEYRIVPMVQEYADQITRWKYEGVYSFYNMENDPEDLVEFRDESNWSDNYFACIDEEGEIVGFFIFEFDPAGAVLTLGLGMAPWLTGKGFGAAFIKTGLEFAKKFYRFKKVVLSVWAENQRAIRCYQNLGFRKIREFNQNTNHAVYKFVEMIFP